MLALLIVLFISYMLGSIPSSLWVGKLAHNVDLRKHGSGNLGTTNTFRILGWKPGLVVLFMDLMKGFASSFWVSHMAFNIGSGPIAPPGWEADAFLMIVCGLMAVTGHMFPVFANFKGGKGAATACGMLYGIEPISIGISSIVFLLITASTRYVSLASILASFLYPINLIILRYGLGYYVDGSIIIFASIVAAGIIYKHKSNIARLIAGTENRVNLYGSSEFKKSKSEEPVEAGAEV